MGSDLKSEMRIAFVTGSDIQCRRMNNTALLCLVAITSVVLSSCASNSGESATTTTTTATPSHQQGTGLPSQTMQSHGM